MSRANARRPLPSSGGHMPRFRHILTALVLVLGLGASRADAITLRDIVELSKEGLSDDVLLALIEVDRSVFPIDADTIRMLKSAGVSEQVIVAIVRSGRSAPPQVVEPPPLPVDPPREPDPAPQPQVIVIDHHDAVEVPVWVPVGVPVYVNAPRRHVQSNTQVNGGVIGPFTDMNPKFPTAR